MNKLYVKTKPYVFSFLFCLFFTSLLRLFNTQHTFDFSHHVGYIISFTIIFTLTSWLWKFSFKHILLFLTSVLLYEAINCFKISNDMLINERGVMQTTEVAAIFFGMFSVCLYAFRATQRKWLRTIFLIIAVFFSILAVIPPLIIIGYGVVSGGKIFSPDIALTLFQTNISEIGAYLHEQNLLLWGVSLSVMFVIYGAFLYYSLSLKIDDARNKNVAEKSVLSVCTVLLLYLLGHDLPRLTLDFTVNLVQSVQNTLQSFAEFEKNKALRADKIAQLRAKITDSNEGIYVLVMGESTARNHMHAYGYARENTPWLDERKQDKNTLLFTHPYSNHVHTVPAVTYAITEQNQYEDVKLADAYSLVDFASAAGYETWWLSNQKRFNFADTPITTISSAADHQIFLNNYVGEKSMTTYHDSKLAEEFPDLAGKKKVFVLVHLMGCHAVYADRYEEEFALFDDGNFRVDSYDNCIAYNDKVLSLLYNRVKNNPYFMSFIYLSDHGEDPDRGLTHESSKFTYEMSRIPFFAVFSDKFVRENPELYKVLTDHKDYYWTSDLLFNLVVDILNIKGLPNVRSEFSLASEKYNFTKDTLLTVHGQKKISGDTE